MTIITSSFGPLINGIIVCFAWHLYLAYTVLWRPELGTRVVPCIIKSWEIEISRQCDRNCATFTKTCFIFSNRHILKQTSSSHLELIDFITLSGACSFAYLFKSSLLLWSGNASTIFDLSCFNPKLFYVIDYCHAKWL